MKHISLQLVAVIALNSAITSPVLARGGGHGGAATSGIGPSSAAAPGTNSLGTAQSSGGGGGNSGAVTTGQAGVSGRTSNRIDGTKTNGPAAAGDNVVRKEDSQDSKADKMIKSICRGC